MDDELRPLQCMEFLEKNKNSSPYNSNTVTDLKKKNIGLLNLDSSHLWY